MQPLKGIKLDAFPIDDLRKVADLISFEGPLLVWLETGAGDDYLFYWCDSDEQFNRWLVFRVENSKLISYMNREIRLRDIVIRPRDGFVYVVDVDSNADYVNTFFVRPEELPEDYIPSVESFYEFDPEFAPEYQDMANKKS